MYGATEKCLLVRGTLRGRDTEHLLPQHSRKAAGVEGKFCKFINIFDLMYDLDTEFVYMQC